MNKMILVIEDNLDIRENIVEILELAAYTVHSANNGQTGLALAFQHLPDMILCDIMMPEMDGHAVLAFVRQHAQLAAIPFIFLTAKSESLDLRKGIELGATDYLVKPFDDQDLLNTIERQFH
jgi:CheY-like chemotaxis protein